MGTMELFLIFTGIASIALSFFIKEKKEGNDPEENREAMMGMAKDIIREELRTQLDSISDGMLEETEAKLDKLANQKILAVGNYSEDVLKNIEDNHNEVMFLYNMLNDKESTLKNTVRDIESVKVSVKKMAEDREYQMAQKSEYEEKIPTESEDRGTEKNSRSQEKASDRVQETEKNDFSGRENGSKGHRASKKRNRRTEQYQKKSTVSASVSDSVKEKEEPAVNGSANNKERILQLYRQGKTDIEIAKELNLGVGEVGLVLGLFK